MESADWDFFLCATRDESFNLRLRIWYIGDGHGGLRIAERPARRQCSATGEAEETWGDVGQARTG
jgi:hypothetical protein